MTQGIQNHLISSRGIENGQNWSKGVQIGLKIFNAAFNSLTEPALSKQ